ncbi:MAG TPA: serine/threonine-protein kinase, partial [Pirellulales bacterium]|nr:serine/threonine-protein kinase [Pirellulales bacterium]
AHAAGLIHRDIKPGNIFSAVRGGQYDVAKLLDFGLAKPLVSMGENSAHLTQAGAITGSPLYMSPEQAVGDVDPDARSDIYSLGAVAYYLLTGSPPFQSDQPLKVILAHVSQEVVPPTRLRSEIPPDIEAIVLRCLAKRPEERFADIAALALALAESSAAGGWNRERAADWWQSELVHPSQRPVEVAAAAV